MNALSAYVFMRTDEATSLPSAASPPQCSAASYLGHLGRNSGVVVFNASLTTKETSAVETNNKAPPFSHSTGSVMTWGTRRDNRTSERTVFKASGHSKDAVQGARVLEKRG